MDNLCGVRLEGQPPEHLVTDPDHSIPIAVPYLTPGGRFGDRFLECVALHHVRAMLFFSSG